jgi:predicted Zn finger-like uncharacterized protein
MHLHFECPSCGQRIRVPDAWVGKELKCSGCNHTFQTSRENAAVRDVPEPPADEAVAEPLFTTLTRKAGADTTIMLDAALGGVSGGILVGILVGGIAGSLREAAHPEIGGPVGGAVAGVLSGFVAGWGIGVLVGVLLGIWGKLLAGWFILTPKRATFLGGILTGMIVAFLVGGYKWMPLGLVLGDLVAALWCWATTWTETFLPALTDFQKKPDSPRPADLGTPRWVIPDTPEKYPTAARDDQWEIRRPNLRRRFAQPPASSWN